MKKPLVLIYGVAVYAAFFGCFLYLIAFLANQFVPRTVDVGPEAPLSVALLIDLGLIALFGVQHSVMARPGFKKWWTRYVPVAMERSTYVLASTVALAALLALWRPIPIVLWQATGPVLERLLWATFAAGWGLLLFATFNVDHFDLFGLKQVWKRFRSQQHSEPSFRVTLLYRLVRHPIYVGWIIAVWATPAMTVGHLVFAAGMTTYILAAIPLEERDLVASIGDDYRDYRERVPALVPWKGASRGRRTAEGARAAS